MTARHRSSAAPLAASYGALIIYASLYPFTGWRVPGNSVWSFLLQGFPHWWTGFDVVSNLLGYMPLGALVFGAYVRSGWTVLRALLATFVLGTALSLAMESLQNFLPHRVPSNIDLALNSAGTLAGALVAVLIHALGAVDRWQVVRQRWFIAGSGGALALLVLWPVGLLFPAPVPFGLGQVWPRLRDTLADWLQDSALLDRLGPWLQARPDTMSLSPLAEFAVVTLGLLAPCLLAYAVSRPGWRRIVLALGAVLIGLSATTLSTALNFGPQHAFAWRTPTAMAATVAALVAAALLAWVPGRVAAGLGLMALGALVAAMAQAPADAYFAESLQGWEQGRFIRFHGVAQWVGWFWPYVAMAWLLARIASREALAQEGTGAGPKMQQ